MRKNGGVSFLKKAVLYLIILLNVFSMSACGKAGEESILDEYILMHYFALPDSVTAISGGALVDDRILLCCREEADEDNFICYIGELNSDGTGFRKLPLNVSTYDVPLDITSDGRGGFWCVYLCRLESDSNRYVLRHYNRTLELTEETSLNEFMEKEEAFLYAGNNLYLNSDGWGNLCVTVKHGKTVCLLFDANGSFIFSIQNRANPMGTITMSTGQIAVCASEDGGATYVLLPIDTDRKAWDASIKLGSIVNVFDGDNSANCYLYKASEFCACDIDAEIQESLFTWSDLGLSSGDSHVFPLPDGAFAVVAGRFSQTQLLSYEYCVVEKGKDERTALTLLSLSPDDSVREAVALFNKSNDDYKIELTAYDSLYRDASREDWDNAITKLNTELISGKLPDLIDLSGLPADAYLRHGLLEDIYPYIQGDPDIDLNNYFDNVFDALSIDGKLPYVTSSVEIFTMLADPSVVGSTQGWTFDEFAKYKSDGLLRVEGLAPGEYLQLLMTSKSQFINWETGECSFDGEEFKKLLSLCKSMNEREEVNMLFPEESEANCIYAPLLSTVFVAQYNDRFGKNANPIGFPNSCGDVMHILNPQNRIGITIACTNKDGAWEFVRSFLEAPMQESGIFFPYLKSSFEKLANAAADGNTIWRGGIYNGRVCEEDVDLAREILGSTYYCGNSEEELVNTIVELSEAYFSGDKSLENVCADIQQRAAIYIAEHK